MAYDEGLAQIMREKLIDYDITEKKMFGGLCFMMRGHMLAGVLQDGGMMRVGKAREAEALELDQVQELSFTGRKMGGLVEFDEGVFEENTLDKLLELAVAFNLEQKPK